MRRVPTWATFKPEPPNYGGFELKVPGPDGAEKSVQVYHGTSIQQLDAVVDLLSNFDLFTESKASINELIKEQQTEQTGTSAAEP